jgi:tetratricopeptide (TPR) repeat protein
LAPLVFTDDPQVGAPLPDPWLAPPEVPLTTTGVVTEEQVEAETITIRTNRPGHPLLVKVAWHPRWRAEGALGPYLAAPALMLIVPQQETVRLRYARTGADRVGLVSSLLALAAAGAWALWSRRRRRAPGALAAPVLPKVALPSCPAPGMDKDGFPLPKVRWGGVIPGCLLLLLVVARFAQTPRDRSSELHELYERASRAYAESRFGDAAEYARHAIVRSAGQPLREELLCLRGESLLQSGQPGPAREAFDTLLQDAPRTPYAAQALFGRARAREEVGDGEGAEADRQRLRAEHADTPWAKRLGPAHR